MKKYVMFLFLFIVGLFFTPFFAIAQEASIPTDQFLMYLLQSLGGIKGASVLAIVGIVIQIVIKFLNSEICNQVFKNFTGLGKLIAISAFTLVGGIVSLMVSTGMNFWAALFHATTLNAIMVLANQFLQQSKKQ